MSFVQKFWMPKKLLIAAYVMIATMSAAIVFQYFTGFETIKIVKTVVYYLILDYAWATIRREWLNSKS